MRWSILLVSLFMVITGMAGALQNLGSPGGYTLQYLEVAHGTYLPGISVSAAPVSYVTATYSTSMSGANNDVVFTANATGYGGTLGNSIDVILTDPGTATGSLSAAINTSIPEINITLTSDGSINTTSQALQDFINNNATIAAYISAANYSTDTGAGTVTALAKVDLTGGINGTYGTKGELRYYSDDLYYLYSGTTYNNAVWKKWFGMSTTDTAITTGAIGLTTTGTVSAEQVTSTDDATIGGDIGVTGNTTTTGKTFANGGLYLAVNASTTISTVLTAASLKTVYPMDPNTGNVTLTLPDAATVDGRVYIINVDGVPGSYYARVTATGGDKINGNVYLVSAAQSSNALIVASNGTYSAITTGTWAQHA